MSEQQQIFINELCQKFDDKYSRLQTFFISIFVVLLSAALVTGYAVITNVAETKKQVLINTARIDYIYENSPSNKAIDKLILTFETQTRVMEMYLPDDVAGAVKEFNKVSAQLRGNIMLFNSNLNTRGQNKINN